MLAEGAEVSVVDCVFVAFTGVVDIGFDAAAAALVTGVAGGARLVSSSQSITSSVTAAAGAAGVDFTVGTDLDDAGAAEAAVEVDEARLASDSCRRATRSAFLPV